MSGRDRGSRGRGGSDRGGGRGGGGGGFQGGRGRGDSSGFQGARGGGDSSGYRGGRGGGGGRGGPAVVYSPPDRLIPQPLQKVTDTEDVFQKGLVSRDPLDLSRLKLDASFPLRPGYGTRGTEVVLWANYVEMVPAPDLVLHRYHIAVSPTAAGKKLGQIIRLLLENPGFAEFRNDLVTDFKANLICRRSLGIDATEFLVQYRAENEDDPRPNATTHRIRLEPTGTFTVADLTEYLTSTNLSANYGDKLSTIQALNIFLGHFAKSTSNRATIGSSKSFSLGQTAAKRDLGAGLTALRGFFSSVRVATCRILVNVNVSHGAFYDAIPLDQLITKYGAANRMNKVKLQSFLKRVRVRVIHLPEKKNKAGQVVPRIKTIFGLANTNDGHALAKRPRVQDFGAGPKNVEFFLDSAPAPSSGPSTAVAGAQVGGKKKGKKGGGGSGKSEPQSSEGRYISVFDFFVKTYNRTISNPNIPVVNVGNRENPSYLPAEVCVVVPGQSCQSKLDPAQTAEMIQFAVRKPWENVTSIVNDGFQTVGLSSQTNLALGRFGLSVVPKLITVPGRILPAPKLKYKQDMSPRVDNGNWNMGNVKVNTGGYVRSWSYILISMEGSRDAFTNPQALQEVIAQFKGGLEKTGLTVDSPGEGSRIAIQGPDDTQIDASLKRLSAKFKLLLVIIPVNNAALYNRIKHVGDVKVGIHTICVVGSKLAKCQMQYFANVALKFNLKLGGVNQLVDNARLGLIHQDKTMVVGLDVTHPSPGSAQGAPSVAGMVASTDKWLAQWPATLRVQASRQERVSELDAMLKSRLQLWKSLGKHQAYPENILVYRDGVSEGQYQMVLDNELPLLRKACSELYPASDTKKGLPHFTIVVVGKRHHTRFYPTKEANADNSSNPRNGTVVDRGVTEARNWDFFMQAHSALQGTARPAHYYVVLDEIFTKQKLPANYKNVADVLEDLTHSMCYLFGRATKAVSICPPAYYADIVCERARCYLSRMFDMPTPSATPAQSEAGGGDFASPEDVLIHPNLVNSMFYI